MKKNLSFLIFVWALTMVSLPINAHTSKKRSSKSTTSVATILNIEPGQLVTKITPNYANYVGEEGVEFLPEECRKHPETYELKSTEQVEESLRNNGFTFKGSQKVKLDDIFSDGSYATGKCLDYVKDGVTVKLYVCTDRSVGDTLFLDYVKILFPTAKLKSSFIELIENMGFKQNYGYYTYGECLGIQIMVKGNTCTISTFNGLVG